MCGYCQLSEKHTCCERSFLPDSPAQDALVKSQQGDVFVILRGVNEEKKEDGGLNEEMGGL